MSLQGDTPLPEQVAYFPTSRSGADLAPAATAIAESAAVAAADQAAPAPEASAADIAEAPASQEAETATAAPAEQVPAAPAELAMDNQTYVTAGEMPSQPAAPAKKGFLASLFGGSQAKAASSGKAPAQQAKAQARIVSDAEPAKPIITLASAEPGQKPLALASATGGDSFGDALPGVRQTALFEIKRKSGIDDDSDVDLNEDDGGLYQVASAAGMARLAPNGLLRQNESVDVACLKPSLVRVLKAVEGRYGKKLVVTSGYRNLDRNRRARGAKNSLHMYCAAADIQVQGISKWELAAYLRTMPGRGGVGTYCHTDSVHIDVGPERDWNWRCRRRK
jgi:uncharacterized protein YcbK (DUF882 family)